MSNWSEATDALRLAREVTLVCAKRCGAENRPGATIIQLDDDGLAVCNCCGHAWTPTFSQEKRA